MWKSVIILSCVASALCAALPKDVRPGFDGRIVGGQAITIDWFPWQVSLQYNGQHFCGGTVYDNVTIITAAHCVVDITSNLTIRAGSSYWNSGGVVKTVTQMTYHGNYNRTTYDYDIAVLRLDSALAFNTYIQPIALAVQEPAHNHISAVSGWGLTSSGSTQLPDQLQAVALQIVGRTECASTAYNHGSSITGRMICTTSPYTQDACQGDSGGPLVLWDYELVGVVSWGIGCAAPGYPGVYTSVAVLRGWILQVVDEMNTFHSNN